MSVKATSVVEYVVVYDILRVLPNGNRVSICDHSASSVGGFSTLELAVSARAGLYEHFSQCGISMQDNALEITPRVVGIPVVGEGTPVVNVWAKGQG